ncbi:MAG: lipolytic enzyme, G-D-S-L [Rhodobacteraceae bacterium]|nr:lipolytic enzyme, G-D-S-L [Paracoccaceae bacterium]MCF8513501.1 lipolytic enzyme, G-D-S-L [Paracoccaceae bacterium]MCF8517599.1 lipolytic enzyme, G-D-S-L [Paracoccaceae bacterium]
MPCLLTFGDSNTHGTPPIIVRGEYHRHGAQIRWPQVCLRALGSAWDLAEEGLPGRTAQYDDPVMGAHMNGRDGLKIALHSHGPVDVMTLMLGTNDVKTRFAATPEMVLSGIAGLLDVALSLEMQARHGGFKILLICPPPVEEVGPIAAEFYAAAARSRALAPLYRDLAAVRGIGFLDAGEVIRVSPQDGIHFDAAAHHDLGLAVAEAIGRL